MSNKIFNQIIDSLTIHGEPDNSLLECVKALSKQQLYEMGFNCRTFSEEELENITPDNLVNQIPLNIKNYYDFTPRELFLNALKIFTEQCKVELPLSEKIKKELDAIKDELFSDTGFLMSRGILFLFQNEGTVTPVLPKENAKIFAEILASDPELNHAENMMDFHKYAAVLTQLYGICPVSIFMEIWNRDYPDKQIPDKSEFKRVLKNCYSVTTHFYLVGNSLIAPQIQGRDLIEKIKEARMNLSVYMPSAEEIKECFNCYDYDEKSDAFRSIKQLLVRTTKDSDYAEHITYSIFSMIKAGTDITKMEDFLMEEFGVTFDKKTAPKFFQMLMAMGMQCHLWTKWGNTGITGLLNLLNEAKSLSL